MWLFTFSIHRYAIALELLSAPLIVLLLCRFLHVLRYKSWTVDPPRWAGFAAVTSAAMIALWSQPADWSRRPWSDPSRPVVSGPLVNPATYLLIEKPVGYVVPLPSPGSRADQVSDIVVPIAQGRALDRRIRSGLANPQPGGVWALHLHGSPPRQNLLDQYGFKFDASRSCETIPGANGVDIEACPLVAAAVPAR